MKQFNATETDILATHLTLLAKQAYAGKYILHDHCVVEGEVTYSGNMGAVVAKDVLPLLKDRIEAMKAHIEAAEAFVTDMESTEEDL